MTSEKKEHKCRDCARHKPESKKNDPIKSEDKHNVSPDSSWCSEHERTVYLDRPACEEYRQRKGK